MNKNKLLTLAGLGVTVYSLLSKKKEKYSTSELEKIKKYSKYLEEKNFVIVDKKKYKKNNKKFKISSIPKYYTMAKKISKVLL